MVSYGADVFSLVYSHYLQRRIHYGSWKKPDECCHCSCRRKSIMTLICGRCISFELCPGSTNEIFCDLQNIEVEYMRTYFHFDLVL